MKQTTTKDINAASVALFGVKFKNRINIPNPNMIKLGIIIKRENNNELLLIFHQSFYFR
ncbi:hypothetical protein [Fischerella thermalis]|uniref:hypothetical protein n=1 Tax=Fischerella thermalis TaxID=372787 RepID=UPI0015E078D6|nr:hypothetical protein [Fischerella thermalis]